MQEDAAVVGVLKEFTMRTVQIAREVVRLRSECSALRAANDRLRSILVHPHDVDVIDKEKCPACRNDRVKALEATLETAVLCLRSGDINRARIVLAESTR
jgi:hypothetical protein